MKLHRIYLFIPLVLIAAGLYFGGCSELDLQGSLETNTPPVVAFTNIPNDSSRYSYNPNLTWYGTDKDGTIEAFYYTVLMKPDNVSDFPEEFADSATMPPDDSWTMVETSNDTVSLSAPVDPDEYDSLYIFITAMDDDSAYSEIKFKLFYRNNHAPDTYLESDLDRIWYTYPYLTDYYKGIPIEWSGSDSLDFPDQEQPAFEYHWQLFGPFDTLENDPAYITMDMLHPDSVYEAYDSTINEMVRWESYDTLNNDVWVNDEDLTLYNLRTGHYIFWVMARDDASVIDSVYLKEDGSFQSMAVFHVLQPYWNSGNDSLKKILVFDHSAYGTLPGEWGDGDSVQTFYMNMFAELGLDNEDITWRGGLNSNSAAPPDVAELVKHEMLLVLNEDWFSRVSDSSVVWYIEYLNVTGKVFVMGRHSFCTLTRGSIAPLTEVIFGFDNGDNLAGNYAADYFDLYSATYPGFTVGEYNQELTGAISVHPDFPELSIDTLKAIEVAEGWYEENNTYLPAVEIMARGGDSETIYNFESYQPQISAYHGWPIATRALITMGGTTVDGMSERTAFQTSYFSFPLFYVEYEGAVEAMGEMLEWYGILE
ncbi:MAG: hypothetical protein GF315_12790 [candidate division Zixibacteria bacterium]|nr:hypothetical protein [candidate division Zixibacteria bacterium]